ncbi:SMP-30/gluconolactonase/LRE family protein [Streptomyces sp. SID1121]|uniref:SMP-30/gluconolactonase/LRE family protein n=1 Tax=Streptomyces sp. SID1121 TaxID=3425888 RepID=UPI004056A0AB
MSAGTSGTPAYAPVVCWSDRLELGEGIRWVDGRIVLTDILTGRLLAAPPGDPDRTGPLDVLAHLPVPLGAVAPVEGGPGSWIAAAGTGVCLLEADGTTRWHGRPEENASPAARMNDGVADPQGRFWAGSMAYDAVDGAGSLYRLDRDGTLTRVLTGVTVPNGPAFSADGTLLFLADSARGVIRTYPVDPATGDLGEPSVFTTLDAGSPDGLAVDQEGGLWTAVWGRGAVHHYRPDGTLDRVVPVPAAQPAGVCLGGHDGRTLYVTTARTGLTHPTPLDGAVFALRVEAPGRPTPPYRPTSAA